MTNPTPTDPPRPHRESMTGEIPLSAVPRLRIVGWLIMAAVTLAGVLLYFLYGDFVTPILVQRDALPASLVAFPALGV